MNLSVADLAQIQSALVLDVKMGGCYFTRSYNPAARDFFLKSPAHKDLDLITVPGTATLCQEMVTANTFLRNFCPLESAYSDQSSARRLYPLRYKHENSTERVYDLFLIHPRLVSEKILRLFMLPFPSEMKVRVTSIHGEAPGSERKILGGGLPLGIRVDAGNLLDKPLELTYRELDDKRIWEKVQKAGDFLTHLLEEIRRHPNDLEKAWYSADVAVSDISGEIAPGFKNYFTDRVYANAERAKEEILHSWEDLDAAYFATFIFPEILKRLELDHQLALAPYDAKNPDDVERYYCLHIPIEQLVEEDHYSGWLPQSVDYRDQRNSVRAQMLGYDE